MIVAIKVRYFASLNELLGRGEDILHGEVNLSVLEIWEKVTGNKIMPKNTLAAVNMEYVDLQYRVADGDEVAFFPPVTGG